MAAPNSAEAHRHVVRFLEHYGYTETLATFQGEAGRLAQPTTEQNGPPDTETLASHLSLLQLDRSTVLAPGDFDFYTTALDSFSQLHSSNILSICVQDESRILATSSTDKTVKLHALSTTGTNTLRTFQHHQAPVLSIDFHPVYAHIMLTTSMDGSSVLVDTSSNTNDSVLQRFKDHQRYVVRGIFSPNDGRYFVTASYDRTICVYENKYQSADGGDDDQQVAYELVGKLGPFLGNVETICFGSSCTLVAGIQNDNYLHFFQLAPSPHETHKLNLNGNGDDWVSFSPVWLSFCPDQPHLLLVSTDHTTGRMLLLDTTTSAQIQNYYIAPSDNKFIARRHLFHPSGRYFYVIGGDDNHTVKVVETKSGHLEATLDDGETGHQAMIRAMALDPSGQCLLTAGFDHTVISWARKSMVADADALDIQMMR